MGGCLFWWCVFSPQDCEGGPGTVIRGQAKFCLKCEWANFHRAPSMRGEVPGAIACQGSSLKDGCLQKKRRKKEKSINIYINKSRHATASCGNVSLLFFYYFSVKFININEQNVPTRFSCEAPTSSLSSLFDFFLFISPSVFFFFFLG